MKQEREFINQGKEHKVYKSKNSHNKILKIPHPYNVWLLNHCFNGVETVKEELNASQKIINNSLDKVRIPETRLIPIKKGYVMWQDYIEEDNSVPNIRKVLREEKLEKLLWRYDSNPTNFASQNGIVYLLDPTRYPLTRMVHKTKIIDEDKYGRIKHKVRRYLKKRKKSQNTPIRVPEGHSLPL